MDELEKIAAMDTLVKMESSLLSISESIKDLKDYLQLETKQEGKHEIQK